MEHIVCYQVKFTGMFALRGKTFYEFMDADNFYLRNDCLMTLICGWKIKK